MWKSFKSIYFLAGLFSLFFSLIGYPELLDKWIKYLGIKTDMKVVIDQNIIRWIAFAVGMILIGIWSGACKKGWQKLRRPKRDVALERIENKIDELNMKSTYNEIDKSIHTTTIDNSTNTTYSCDTPLSPEAVKLIDEKIEKAIEKKLEKMNGHTMANIKKACIDKPEEMGKFIEIFSLYKLSVAGNTVTTHNLMPWLTGETTVEPVEPMPSGDFIEQLPNAIDDVIDFDSIEDFDSIGAKMNQEQTYNNCRYFDIRNLCPHRDDELMINFINDTSLGEGYRKTLDSSKGEEVNKLFCNTCTSFKDNRS